jgi:hypothetical protein
MAISDLPNKTSHRSSPLEGILYDKWSLANFVDLEHHNLIFALRRSWNTDFFTKFFDVQLPSKVSISYQLLTFSNLSNLVTYQPKGKVSLSTQLVDLGGGEKRTQGALKVSYCPGKLRAAENIANFIVESNGKH